MNKRVFKNNAFSHEENSVTVNISEQSDKLKPVIKTVFIDTDSHISKWSAVIGIVMLFFCILAGCAGLIFCLSDSFSLGLDFSRVVFQISAILIVFTVIYFFPSRLFTVIAFLAVAGLSVWYIIAHLDEISSALNYTINYCLFRITQEGYVLPSIVDYNLAALSDAKTAGYINTSVFILTSILTCIISYIAYSKKSMWIALLVSLTIIFPGFFYGLIPSYFSFSLVIAFLVSIFAINIFESGSIAAFIDRNNKIPERKLEKYKYKHFKKQYYKNVNDIKKEIREIAKSPNRDENSLRLNRLVRELQKISNNQDLFLRFYGLNKFYKVKSKKNNKISEISDTVNNPAKSKQSKQKKEKFISPLKAEKLRIIHEKQKAKEEVWAEYERERRERRKMPMRSRIALSLKTCFSNKVGHSAKSGYAGFCAFVIAVAAIIAVQPFISPKAKFKANAPEQILNMLTNTVEYLLVGSNSGVYGGYKGGMGGGFLLSPNGANFENKPILKITSSKEWTRAMSSTEMADYPTLQSGVIYLKGWYGNIYNGKMWLAADKNHIDDYALLRERNPQVFWDENHYFLYFTSSMQSIFGVTEPRRSSELVRDSVTIEHLVTGGRLVFMPYFCNGWTPLADFSVEKEADLNYSIIRPLDLLFKYPKYGATFYSVDNILNRADFATDDLREYINYYENDFKQELEWAKGDANLYLPNSRTADNGVIIRGNNNYFSNSSSLSSSSLFDSFNNYYAKIITLRSMEDFYNAETEYYDFVRKYYLSTPSDLPQEVIDLAEKITWGAESNFDKSLLIEEYLANNHEYTLHPRMPNDPNKDFVYNFLFDTKEGYCTYYATSMVVMLRSLGIPSRFVEGYLVDTTKRQKDEDGNMYITVYDTSAHAWPEVYFKGIGWIPFEPTTSVVETPEETKPYEYTPPARLPAAENQLEYTTEDWSEEEDDILMSENANRDLAGLYFRVAIVLVVILLIIVFNLCNYIINLRRLKHFKNAKTNDAVVKILAYTLKLLKYCGFVMYNDEGLTAFADRVSNSLEIFNGVGFKNSAAIMQKARYSCHEISEEERLYVYDFVIAVRKSAMDKLKLNLKLKFKYVYFIL